MRLYALPPSSNTIKVLALINLLDIPVEIVPVDLQSGFQRSPEYLALNPNATMPTLVDEGLALWESNAILVYLAQKTPGQTVLPADPGHNADVLRWLFWSSAQLGPPSRVFVLERTVKPFFGDTPDESKVAGAEGDLIASVRVLEAHLGHSQYLVGDNLTLADLAVAANLMKWQPARMPIEGYANTLAWLTKITSLPAWQKAVPQMAGR